MLSFFSTEVRGQYVTYCDGVRLYIGEPEAHPSSCGLLRVPVWFAPAPSTSFTELRACGLFLEGELSGAMIEDVVLGPTDGFNQSGLVNASTESTFSIGYTSGSTVIFDLDDASSDDPHFWIDVKYLTDQDFSFQTAFL